MEDLHYKAKLDIDEVRKSKAELVKMFKDLNISSSMATGKGFDVKPLTEYQAGLLKVKQDTLEFAKQKAEAAKADKSASLATQAALREERLLIQQRNAELKNAPRKVDMGRYGGELSATPATIGDSGKVNTAFTSYLQGLKRDFDAGKISAAQYTAELERYSTVLVQNASETKKLVNETKTLGLSKKELAKDLAIEKLRHTENAAAIKNSAREAINEKGSLENRRAALIRLTAAYDRLNVAQRSSPSGVRLQGIVGGLSKSVGELELATNRGQRSVGQYTNAFASGAKKAWSALKTVANILPGVGIAGLLGFALDPIIDYISQLDLFKKKIDNITESRKEISQSNLKGAQDAQLEIVQLKTLYDAAKNINTSSDQRYQAAKKLQDQYPNTFKNYSIEQIELGKVDAGYLKLAQSVIATARARASEQKIADNSSKILEFEDKNIELQRERLLLESKVIINKKSAKSFLDLDLASQNKLLDIYKSQVENKKEQDKLTEKNLKLTENIVNQQKKGAVIADASNKKTKSPSTAKEDTAIEAQRSLQASIDEMVNKSKRKKLSDDDEEIANIKASYATKIDEAKRYNEAVEKFNKDPKNKVKKDPVTIKALEKAVDNDVKAAVYRQETKLQADAFEKQKQLYADYENYKTDFGDKAAKERYGKEVKTNKQLIAELEKDVLSLSTSGGSFGSLNNEQTERLAQKAKQLGELKKMEDAAYKQAFEAAKGFNDRLIELQVKHDADVLALGDKATAEQLANLDKILKDGTSKLSLDQLINSDDWVNLFSNLDDLTVAEIDKLINTIGSKSKELSKNFNPVDIKQVQDNLEKAKQEILTRNPFQAIALSIKSMNEANADGTAKSAGQIKKEWNNLADATSGAFNFIEDAIKSCDLLGDAIGETGQQAVASLASVVKSGISIATTIAEASAATTAAALAGAAATTAAALAGEAAVTTAEKASVILAIISAALQIAQAIANVVKGIFAANDKKIEKSIKAHKNEVELLTAAYADLERAVNSAIGENIYRQQEAQIKNLQDQQAKLLQMRKEEESKKKADQGKINEYNKQIQDAANQVIDINKKIAEGLIQTNFKDLSASFADALTDAFKEAANSGEALDKVLNNMVANAIKNSLKIKLLEPVISEFTDALSKYAKENNDSIVGFDFETYREKIKKQADLFNQGLAASGDFFKSDKGQAKDQDAFLKDLGDKYLKALETSDLAKKVEDYNKRLAEATAKGLSPTDVAEFKKQYDELAAIAIQKQDEFFKLTGQKIVIDPISLQFNTITEQKTNEENAKSLGDKLFDLITKKAEETGKSIEEILKQSILDGLRAEIITDALKPLADKVKALYANGKIPTKDEIAKATAEMSLFVANAKAQLKTLEDATGFTFSEVIKEDVSNALKELEDGIKSVSDSIINVFDGTQGAMQDFEANWDKMVKNTFLKQLQTKSLQGKLTDFMTQFNSLDKVEDSKKQSEIERLKSEYDRIIRDGKTEYDRLQKVFGVDYTKPKEGQSQVATAIGRSITEDSASALTGLWATQVNETAKQGITLARIYSASIQNLEIATKIEQNTFRTANNTDRLQAMEAALQTIAVNTKTSVSRNDRDLGITRI